MMIIGRQSVPRVLNFFAPVWEKTSEREIADAVLRNRNFWNGSNLTEIAGLSEAVAEYLSALAAKPARDVVKALVGEV